MQAATAAEGVTDMTHRSALATEVRAGVAGLPDDQLVERIRAGTPLAVEALVARHHEALLTFCRHMLGRLEPAEAIAAASLDQAIAAVRRHDRPVHIRALLFAIARGRCGAARLEGTDLHGLDPEVRRDPELRALVDGIGRLPADQRAALLLAELHHHSREEIAAIVGCPGDKVEPLVAGARIALAGVPEPEPVDWACAHVRPLLAADHAAIDRRDALRRHVGECADCDAFRKAIAHERRLLAIVLPVTPSAA